MPLKLYGHPFSSYTWKALIALYEKELPFEFCALDPQHPEGKNNTRLLALWPLNKFPVLEDGDSVLIESSIIIEHLDLHHPGPRMIPTDPATALEVRFMDRVFDNHVMNMMQAIVAEHLPFITEAPDPGRLERARAALVTIYDWLDKRLPKDGWACGPDFSLADCAGAPSLFYADWVHEITEAWPTLKAYRERCKARSSVARCIDAARPYRQFFPLGAPDRD